MNSPPHVSRGDVRDAALEALIDGIRRYGPRAIGALLFGVAGLLILAGTVALLGRPTAIAAIGISGLGSAIRRALGRSLRTADETEPSEPDGAPPERTKSPVFFPLSMRRRSRRAGGPGGGTGPLTRGGGC